MSLLGEHGGFILASYLAAGIGILGLLIWVITDYRTQKSRLADLEAQGLRRRSDPRPADPVDEGWDT